MMMKNVNQRAMGRRLRELREGCGFTQEELAERVGISTSFVGHIERGEKPCSLETMSRLAICLDSTMDYIVLGRQNLCSQQSCALYNDLRELLKAYGDL